MEGWRTLPLGEACLIRPPKKEAKSKLIGEDAVSFIPMDTLRIRQKTFDTSQSRRLNKVYSNYTYFTDGDVLLAKITPCFQNGKLGIARSLINGVGFGSSEFFVLRCSEQIDPEFLFYFFSRESFADEGVAQMSGAVGHQRVPLGFIESYPFSFPPLPEQKRIVTILDEAFAAIETATANAEKNLANAKELLESYLSDLSSDKKPLGDFVDIKTGRLNANAAVEGGKYPFFTCSREVYEIDEYAFDCEAVLLAGNNASGDFNVKHYKGKFNAYQRTYVLTIQSDA